jgi:hypothetical protein
MKNWEVEERTKGDQQQEGLGFSDCLTQFGSQKPTPSETGEKKTLLITQLPYEECCRAVEEILPSFFTGMWIEGSEFKWSSKEANQPALQQNTIPADQRESTSLPGRADSASRRESRPDEIFGKHRAKILRPARRRLGRSTGSLSVGQMQRTLAARNDFACSVLITHTQRRRPCHMPTQR